MKAQTTALDLPPDSSIAETSLLATSNGVSNADTIELPGSVANTHPDSHDESGDPSRVVSAAHTLDGTNDSQDNGTDEGH